MQLVRSSQRAGIETKVQIADCSIHLQMRIRAYGCLGFLGPRVSGLKSTSTTDEGDNEMPKPRDSGSQRHPNLHLNPKAPTSQRPKPQIKGTLKGPTRAAAPQDSHPYYSGPNNSQYFFGGFLVIVIIV